MLVACLSQHLRITPRAATTLAAMYAAHGPVSIPDLMTLTDARSVEYLRVTLSNLRSGLPAGSVCFQTPAHAYHLSGAGRAFVAEQVTAILRMVEAETLELAVGDDRMVA